MLLHNKGNYKQGEKTAFRMGENTISLTSGAGKTGQPPAKEWS